MSLTMVIDSLDLAGWTARFPEQVHEAARSAAGVAGLPNHDAVENVVVLGTGAAALAGQILVAVSGPLVPVPVVVSTGYAPPSFVGPDTLCLAVSLTGDTDETVEAAHTAAAAGAHMVVVARDGQLVDLAPAWQAPVLPVAAGVPLPRAGLGALTVPLFVVLEQVGLFRGASGWIDDAARQLQTRRDQLMEPERGAAWALRPDTLAAKLARTIGRTMPLVVGAGPLGAVAARRWKTQVNENAKAPAFMTTVPEMGHDEVCGWGQHGDVTRQVFTLVELRHDEEHPQETRRFERVREIMSEVVSEVVEVRAAGEGPLAQVFDLMFVGDVVSLHLAFQESIDPGPTPAKDAFTL